MGGKRPIQTACYDNQGLVMKFKAHSVERIVPLEDGRGLYSPVAIPKVGIIRNPRSRLNRQTPRPLDLANADIVKREPETREDLALALGDFARMGVDLIVIDGGDGTVRDVLTAAARIYRGRLPRVALLPSGKTNALALDLGIPTSWTLQDVVRAYRAGTLSARSPITVARLGKADTEVHGFLFGSGAFARATALAQGVHRKGWFNGPAIALAMASAITQTILGGKDNRWRRGEQVRFSLDGKDFSSRDLFLLLGTTLERMPLGLKPMGPVRPGLKLLAVEAPPRRVLRNLVPLLTGKSTRRMADAGFVHHEVDRLYLSMRGAFILDGERYSGGKLVIAKGAPISFVTP